MNLLDKWRDFWRRHVGFSTTTNSVVKVQSDGMPTTCGDSLTHDSTTGATGVDAVDFDTSFTPAAEPEGRAWWNGTDYTLNLSTGRGPVLQVGQENYLPFTLGKNMTGSTISDGAVVYLTASGSDNVIELANSRDPAIASRLVGITTESIDNGETGMVTTYGKVRGLNTSSYSLGDILYVSPDTDGALTATRPTDGDFVIAMAIVTNVDAADGEIFVRYLDIRDPDDIKNATGFPDPGAVTKSSDVSFVNSTRTFTIEPNTGGGFTEFYVWQLGMKYIFTSAQNLVITDVEGTHWIYFDEGVLSETVNPSAGQSDDLIRNKVLVAMIYWDATNNEAKIIGNERHGHVMSSDTHSYLHFTRGAQWISGIALSDFVLGNGDDDEDAQFTTSSGVTTDEDVTNISGGMAQDDITAVDTGTKTFTVAGDVTSNYRVGQVFRVSMSTGNDGDYTIASLTYTTSTAIVVDEAIPSATADGYITLGLPVFYLDGANADLRRIDIPGFSVVDDVTAGVGATGRLVWNELTGGVWQLTTLTNNDFVLCHVFATNSPQDPVVAFIGQGDYLNRNQARAGAETEISTILTSYPSPELIPIATIIFQTSNGYANEVQARTQLTADGDDYVDWRTTELLAGAAPADHANLSGLELAQSGVTYGHVDDQAQTIAGVKTFSSFPVTPSTSPTTDYQVANKIYVDNNSGASRNRLILGI